MSEKDNRLLAVILILGVSECTTEDNNILLISFPGEGAGQWVWLVAVSINTFSLRDATREVHSRTLAMPSAPALAKKGLEE